MNQNKRMCSSLVRHFGQFLVSENLVSLFDFCDEMHASLSYFSCKKYNSNICLSQFSVLFYCRKQVLLYNGNKVGVLRFPKCV